MTEAIPTSNDASDTHRRQDWREHRSLYLDEWRLNVDNEKRAEEKTGEFAVQYAQIAVRGAYVLNGGALVALPPLMTWLSVPRVEGSADSAIWFVIGLISAALCAFSGYCNFYNVSMLHAARAYQRAAEVNATYADKNTTSDPDYQEAKSNEKKFVQVIDITMATTIGFGVASHFAFIFGVLAFKVMLSN